MSVWDRIWILVKDSTHTSAREEAAITVRLRAAASLRVGATVGPQGWGRRRTFPGQVIVNTRKGTLDTAAAWSRRDTVWTDGSRFEDGRVGAACVWRTSSGWDGRCFHLGGNKEVFDAETYAIAQALDILDRRQERGRRYTIFVGSTSAIDRIMTGNIGPGQRFGVAAIEGCVRVMARNNEVTTRWVPAHHGVTGNERADEHAKVAAEGDRPDSAVPDELRRETSLSHITRVATEARARRMKQWISERLGDPRRKHRPPPGKGVRRKLLRRAPKHIAGRYYQLLSGHAAIGPYLEDKVDDDRCWCGGGKRQTRHHLFTECRAWAPQIRRLWSDIGKAHGWKHPRAPPVRWLWREKSTGAVLDFLGSTRVGCIRVRSTVPEEAARADLSAGGGGGEGGPGPPAG